MILLAVFLAIASGIVLFVAEFTSTPSWLGVIATIGFVVNLVIVATLAFLEARRTDVLFGRALWQSVRAGVRWLTEALP